ncbi:MAG: carbohydrate binding family 9 domain-containing protein [Saprospiraceae bacterium]|nr:carbohydrate binding family 9 domain-containing protein [Saprospiraceae bacterium]
MRLNTFFTGLLCLVWLAGMGQNGNNLSIKATKAAGKIHLDGNLDEAAWVDAQMVTDFNQNFPFDTLKAALQTEVKVTFDDAFLYVGAKIYEPRADYIIESLKRDFPPGPTDVFIVNIDPFKDKLTGFHFAVSPYNIQREGLIDDGSNVSRSWDNKWYSAVSNTEEYWIVEMAIPFKTLRYKLQPGENTWRINFARNSVKQNEQSTWGPIPRQFGINNTAFSGLLIWDTPPPKPGLNVSLIPYVTAEADRDYELGLPLEDNYNAGLDAKIAITPSLNLDLTINPDFSQVEVDQQIINLSRFELFFPERRQFFLENEDLFAKFGFPSSRPFFSRRIGLSFGTIEKVTTGGDTIQVDRQVSVPILAGARLSGKLDDNWRIGLLNMQTAKVDDIGLNPANYSVGVLQRKVFERSYAGLVFANKENFVQNAEGGYSLDQEAFNRVVGVEYNLFSADNKWEGEFFYHRSFTNGDNEDAQAAAIFLGYNTRHWRFYMPTHYVGRNHRADIGFIPRPGFFAVNPGFNHTLFPKSAWWAKRIISYGVGMSTNFTFNLPDYNLTDQNINPYFFLELPGNSNFNIGYSRDYVYLFFPFDPTRSGENVLQAGEEFNTNSVGMYFNSDVRKDLYYEIELNAGGFFNTNSVSAQGAINYRLQPYGVFALSFQYTHLDVSSIGKAFDYWILGPRAEMAFSRNLFLSAFLQYNTQANNVNLNARLQWRFLPVSDLFLVYTDNYYSDNFFVDPGVKNRAIVLKATYWLNL